MKKVSLYFLLIILLSQSIFALDIMIVSPEKGSIIESWGTYIFTVTDQPNQTADCTLNFDNKAITAVQIKTNEQAAIKQLTPVGELNWSLHCVVNGGTVDSMLRPITSIDASPPEIVLLSPINATVLMNDTLIVNVSVKDSSKISSFVLISAINRSYNRTKDLDEDHGFYVTSIPVGKKFIPGDYLLTVSAKDNANRTVNRTTSLTVLSVYGIAMNQPVETEEKKPIIISGIVTDYSLDKVNNKEVDIILPNNERISIPVTDGNFFYTLDSTGMTSGTITAEMSDGQRIFSDSTEVVIITEKPNPAVNMITTAQNTSQETPVILEKVKTDAQGIMDGTALQKDISEKNEDTTSSAQLFIFLGIIGIIVVILFLVKHKKSKTFEADLYDYLRRRNKRSK